MTSVAPINRTLDQELTALLRGVNLECLVCGEFVLHAGGMITCPECDACLRAGIECEKAELQFDTQAG